MLEAFAHIAEKIPEWKLRLVGSVDSRFEPYIESFFERHPDLNERIVFTGQIQDRECLKNEYSKAKIFAFTSRLEGGAPNVISEALHAGCVMATTKIDAYEDITGNGKCGMAAEIDDIEGVARMLFELCMNSNLEEMAQKSVEQANDFYDMEKIVGGLYGKLNV